MKHRELPIHISILDHLRTVLPEPIIVAHLPNGGQRTARAGALMKRMGTVAGMPDLLCILPGGKSLFFEIKAPNGRPSPAQEELWKRMAALGHTCAKVSSIDDVRLTLKALGIATREAA